MTGYDIVLGQGDTDNVAVVLKSNGVGANLAGAVILFSMANAAGVVHDITCLPGATITVNGESVVVPVSAGGVTIPFTDTHTANAGLYQGKFPVTLLGAQTTFPSGNDYVSVRIWEAI